MNEEQRIRRAFEIGKEIATLENEFEQIALGGVVRLFQPP
jgi:hypothetical protein